jgi:hypothetical protein
MQGFRSLVLWRSDAHVFQMLVRPKPSCLGILGSDTTKSCGGCRCITESEWKGRRNAASLEATRSGHWRYTLPINVRKVCSEIVCQWCWLAFQQRVSRVKRKAQNFRGRPNSVVSIQMLMSDAGGSQNNLACDIMRHNALLGTWQFQKGTQ